MGGKQKKAFGSSVKRFRTLGIHPGFITTTDNNLSPGQYHPKFHQCDYKNTSSWFRKQETEEFSKFLGFRNAKILQEREFRKSQGGPGTYTFETDLEIINLKKNFGNQKRFGCIRNNNPGPGTYRLKEIKTKFNEIPPFEWDGLVVRFKDVDPPYLQAPNRYEVMRKFEKVISKRGPYDTFTGPRDGSTIKNHFAPSSSKPLDLFYEVVGDLDYLLKHPKKFWCGKFSQSERFPENSRIFVVNGLSTCLKDPGYPGPDHYETNERKRRSEEKSKPFNSSNIYARPPTIWKIHPGPERYNPKMARCKKMSKPSWMFLSKEERNFFKIEDFAAF